MTPPTPQPPVPGEHGRGLARILWRGLFAFLFIAAGINHFVNTDFYVGIMPPYLPWHRALVYASGVIEIMLGALLLVPRLAVPAAWGLIALLIAVFPANIHMALHVEEYPRFSPVALWARLPLQAVLVAWAYALTRTRKPSCAPR